MLTLTSRYSRASKLLFCVGVLLAATGELAASAPKFAYIANAGSNSVSAYSVDAVSGALTPVPGSPFAAGNGPFNVAIDPSGRFAYVANSGDNNVSAYAIDAAGALTPVLGSPFAAGVVPEFLTVDPSGRFLYVVNVNGSNVSAYTIDATTGALTQVPGSPFPAGGVFPQGIAVSPDDKFAYLSNNVDVSAYTIDPTTGALTAVPGSPFPAANRTGGVAVAPSGRFVYVTASAVNNLVYAYAINGTTGALTQVAGSPFPTGSTPVTVAVDPLGKFLYTPDYFDNAVSAYTIDATTGALTQVPGSPFLAGSAPAFLGVDPSGKFLYVTSSSGSNVFAYTIDATTGVLTTVPGSPFATGNTPLGVAVALHKVSTAIGIVSSTNPSILNQTVTFTATVTPVSPSTDTPTGMVTFLDGATTVGFQTLSGGQASLPVSNLSVGTHSITAAFGGDSNFLGSTGSLTQQVAYSICALYDQTKSVKSGAVFPIKVQLCDVNGGDVSSSSTVLHATSVTGISGYSGDPETVGNANPDNDFRFDATLGTSGGYIFNLSTKGLASGTYTLRFTAGSDPATHSVTFGVK